MDTLRIIETDGYRYEDLSKENQDIINWLGFLVDDLEGRLYEYNDSNDDSLLERLVKEISREAVEDVIEYAHIQIAEYQISLIENQPDV